MSNKLLPLDNWATGIYSNANRAWEALYVGLNYDAEECSPRGLKCKETLGCDITILNPMDNLVYNKFRGLSPIYLAKEYMWYNDNPTLKAEDAGKLSKFWLTLADSNGNINSNYGYHIFKSVKANGKSQWDSVIEILKDDPDSRKAIIQLPIVDTKYSKDTICTSSLQFFIRNNKLHLIVYMRSNDVVLGFPIDVFQFTMWQIRMAKELGVELGTYRHIAGSLHVYEKNYIENVDDSFEYSEEKFDVFDKSSDEFIDDLKNLANKNYDNLNDNQLKVMLERRKVWK